MTSREMQEAVEIELRQRDKYYETRNKLESKEIFHFLTKSERDYAQDIYDSGIDKNEENKKKLGNLLQIATISGADIVVNSFYPSAYSVTMPDNVLYVINDRATTSESQDIFVKPITFDEYNVNKNSPFRKTNNERFLRLQGNNEHIILTPNETLISLKIDYVKTPLGINVGQNCELHESVHNSIVTGAVKLILGAMRDQVGYNIQYREENENK